MAQCTYKDCLIAPIPDDCFFFCIYQILLRANPEEKVSILRMTRSTAESIFRAFNTFRVSNYEELISRLSRNETSEILRVFRNVTQEQLNHFANK